MEEKMGSVSFPLYPETATRFRDYKKKNDLTFDAALNKLIDIAEKKEIKESGNK